MKTATPNPTVKTYAIDVLTTVMAATHGKTYTCQEYRQVLTMPATRHAKALRQAARLFPDQQIRARLVATMRQERGSL